MAEKMMRAPEHATSCLEFAALQSRRVVALAALSSNPIQSSQTNVSPSQDLILRELECVGLKMRGHAVACGRCAALWYAARLYSSNHLSLSQVHSEIGARGGAQ